MAAAATTTMASAPTAASPAASAKPKRPLRENMIKNALGFLKHADVVSSPLADKVRFLLKKGLTKEEVAEAVRRADPNSNDYQLVLDV